MKIVEYKVRPVGRYVVTRFTSDDENRSAGIETIGEFASQAGAEEIASALAGKAVRALTLPEGNIPAMLRNIAESVESGEAMADRGVVALVCSRGKASVFGLGATVGDPYEILTLAGESLKKTIG